MPGTQTSLCKVQKVLTLDSHILSVDKLLWLITPSGHLLPDISLKVFFIVASCNDESTVHNYAAGELGVVNVTYSVSSS